MFKAIGLVIGLIAVRILMPDVFHAFEYASVSFFKFLAQIFNVAPGVIGSQMGNVGSVNYIPSPAPLPSYIYQY
jgi:hypothetical protein